MKRCSVCIMPETVPGISFNAEGICNFCQNYKSPSHLEIEGLNEIVVSAKNQKKKYDCIVPLSGGRDSTYVLYIARAMLDMKVLAVSYDNEFRSEQALVNIENACRILNAEFISVRSQNNVMHKIVKHNLLGSERFRKYPGCGACTYGGKSAVYRAAERHNVPLILWGDSSHEYTLGMQELLKGNQRGNILKQAGLLNMNILRALYYRLLQRIEFSVPGNRIFSIKAPMLKNKSIKEISVYNYIQWDRKKIKETIMNELLWEKPADHVSTWRIDCLLDPLINFSFVKSYGCTKACFGYCNMINGGQIEREEALRQEEYMLATLRNNLRELLEEKIGLCKKESETILNSSLID